MEQTAPVLVIMAAGMGSRFGGLKQITPVDAAGDFILDFSLYDAYRAGFRRVAFIIKPEMEQEFHALVGAHIAPFFGVQYIHQTLDVLPQGFTPPAGRTRPWGTGHAVACCRGHIHAPFAVINSDDFYGAGAFQALYQFLTTATDPHEYGIVSYLLRNTVSDHGTVARGVCTAQNGYLASIHERTNIAKQGHDAVCTDEAGRELFLPGDTPVSMNCWAFQPQLLDSLWAQLPDFLQTCVPQDPEKSEFFLPAAVDHQMQRGEARVRMLSCREKWYGVTYREDLQTVYDALEAMKTAGHYPPQLWNKTED